MLRFSTIASLVRTMSRNPGRATLIAFLPLVLGGTGFTGCDCPLPASENFIVNVNPKTVVVNQGDTFEIVARAETSAPFTDTVTLYLVHPSPSGAPFDSTVAVIVSGCSESSNPGSLPPKFGVSRDSGDAVGWCTFRVRIKPSADPGTYELVVQGGFNKVEYSDVDALDDSNPIALTILEPDVPTTGWQVVFEPPLEDISRLNDLDFPSENVGYAVGQARDGGAIAYKTSDGGENWSRLSISTAEEAQRVEFLTESIGYVGGGDASTGFLYRTTDGGASWIDVGANMPMNILVRAMSFLDPQTGYVAGSGGSNWVMFTDDGGATWKEIDWGGASSFSVSDMHFYSVDAGYISVGARVAGSGRVYYTSDAGVTWAQATGGDAFKKNIGGFAVQGNNRLFVSSDSGKSWSTRTVAGVSAVNGISSGGGTNWIAGSAGGAYIAYGVGTSWAPDWQNASVHPVVDLEMFGPTKGVAMGGGFIAYRYPD